MTARPVSGGLHVEAAHLLRQLDKGKQIPPDRARVILASVAPSESETVRERR